MAGKAQRKVKFKDFEDRAARYGSDVQRATRGRHGAIFDMGATVLSSRAPADCNLLVVAAGGGAEFSVFGSGFPDRRMTGVDPSAAMPAMTKKKAKDMGIGERLQTICGTTAGLPPGESFDAAICLLVMAMIKDDGLKLAFLTDVAKRLKPKAPLLLADPCAEAGSEGFWRMMADVKAYGLSSGLSAHVVDEFQAQAAIVPIVQESREMELLEQAGFEVECKFFKALIWNAWIAHKK